MLRSSPDMSVVNFIEFLHLLSEVQTIKAQKI